MGGVQDKRLWLGGGIGLAVVIALLSWFFVINPGLTTAGARRDAAVTVQQQNVVLAGKLTTLRRENSHLTQLTANLQTALDALPFDTGLPEFTRQLNSQAADSGVELASIAVSAAKTATGSAPSTTGTPVTAGAILAIPVTVIANGTTAEQLDFMNSVQVGGPRRALVLSVQLDQASGSRGETMTLLVNVFTAPLSQTAQAQLEKLLRGDISN